MDEKLIKMALYILLADLYVKQLLLRKEIMKEQEKIKKQRAKP